jgi:hypothetical protein
MRAKIEWTSDAETKTVDVEGSEGQVVLTVTLGRPVKASLRAHLDGRRSTEHWASSADECAVEITFEA